jgi:hypothetical protein
MNRNFIAAAALAAVSASAFAIEGEQFVPDATSSRQASTLTREEVRAEVRELQSAGWQPMQEASPTPLQAAEMDRRIAQLPSQQRLAQANTADEVRQSLRSEDQQIALVDDGDGSVIIIEAVPIEESQVPSESSLPFEHPALPDSQR